MKFRNPRYAQVYDEAFDLPLSSFKVYAVVALYFGHDTCWASIDTISAKAGLGRRQTQRCLRELEKLGFVTCESHRGSTNSYEINMIVSSRGDISTTCVTSVPEGGVTSDAQIDLPNIPPLPPSEGSPPRKGCTSIGSWEPTDEDIRAGTEKGLSREACIEELAQLRDWAASKDIRRHSWSATYRNWLRRHASQRGGRSNGGGHRRSDSALIEGALRFAARGD